MEFDDLTEPERAVWTAFPRGERVDLRCGDAATDDAAHPECWGSPRIVRAQVISALLLGARDLEPGYCPAVRLRGARITGHLDLMGAVISHALVLEGCRFDQALRFAEATTKTIRIVDSQMPGFNGARMRAEGTVNFYRSVIERPAPPRPRPSHRRSHPARRPCRGRHRRSHHSDRSGRRWHGL